MTMHNFGWDINHIITKSNKQGQHLVESYTLQLDDLISNMSEMTPEFEKLLHYTIEFLHGLVVEEEN